MVPCWVEGVQSLWSPCVAVVLEAGERLLLPPVMYEGVEPKLGEEQLHEAELR